MGHLQRRETKSGPRYDVRYRTPEGTVRTRTFRRKADAERFRSTTEVEVSVGDWVDPRRGRITLSDWVEQWWATTVDLRPSSRARDESYLRSQILPVFGDWPLASIDHLSVRTWVAELASRRQPATVHKAVGILRKVLTDAVDGGSSLATRWSACGCPASSVGRCDS